jgi:hypothetical protein
VRGERHPVLSASSVDGVVIDGRLSLVFVQRLGQGRGKGPGSRQTKDVGCCCRCTAAATAAAAAAAAPAPAVAAPAAALRAHTGDSRLAHAGGARGGGVGSRRPSAFRAVTARETRDVIGHDKRRDKGRDKGPGASRREQTPSWDAANRVGPGDLLTDSVIPAHPPRDPRVPQARQAS